MVSTIEQRRHSLAHLLAAAVLRLWPETKVTIGPIVENGFYYDLDLPVVVSDKELPKIEKTMREILKDWKDFSKRELTREEAEELFNNNPYKLELIAEIVDRGEAVTVYTSGDFTDLCRGDHVEIARDIKPDSFKLVRASGAYWRGNEKNKMLTRIYGVAFETKDELDAYLTMLEEAKKRDHKKLGKELDLFTFSELVGPGLPLWTPKGTIVRNLLDEFVWSLRSLRGYERVEIPHITKKDLYITSGHWEKYQDDLFKITTREGHEFAMKPMNCPHHTQIYARKQWSYKELPQRYANTTTCYRDEQSGELSGLSRVRAFAQDDAHVFCRMAEVKSEFLKIWDIIHEFYPKFGFDLKVRLSRHDPTAPEKYLGDADRWQMAEDLLREIIAEKKMEAIDGVGEAAFYGPKLDFMAHDSIGREWQVATIQLDMNMPERFDLTCVNDKGEKERIVMIHAAIMGSIERFLSIVIEHYAGAFPLWLAPVQVVVVPIGENQMEYAQTVHAHLKGAGVRAELDASNESLGKKIREAKKMKVPYILVLGEKEVDSATVTIESRDHGNIGQKTLEECLHDFRCEIDGKGIDTTVPGVRTP